jgi:hypothetical protein
VTLSEPDVALTDFGLAIECAVFAGSLYWGRRGRSLRTWWILFFGALGGGALLGGITHGFVTDDDSALPRALWSATLFAIGLAALACWVIGGYLLFPQRAVRQVIVVAVSLFAAYVVIILFVSASFAIAIVHYGLAGAFLLAAFIVIYRRRRQRAVLAGIAGTALSYAAAAVQQSEIAMPALNLSHNALYHLIQAVALLLIFLAARILIREVRCARDATS